jgi:hypothetical protein
VANYEKASSCINPKDLHLHKPARTLEQPHLLQKLISAGKHKMPTTSNLNLDDLLKALEPLLRRIVREELSEAVKNAPNLFYLHANMPIYQDIQDIAQRKIAGNIKLHSHAEVWGE